MGLFTKKTPHTAGEVDRSRLPRHIAVIMDGNGRWAKKRGLPRTVGHKAGAEVFRDIATYCKELGVEYLTVYAFSTENWKRPADEVLSLIHIFTKKESYSCRGTKRPSLRPQAQHLLASARAFPHVTGVFLIVVVPPTVPAQLSAAAACYYGKNYSFCRVAG